MNVLLFQGQGAQFKGMGSGLWEEYPHIDALASQVLGYSVKQLCLEDTHDQLRLTQYTQPALYTVNALHYYRWQALAKPLDAVAGHSLGEYSALLAAGCFDFETGLRLVQKRGQLMGQASGGSMAAVLGMSTEALHDLLLEPGLEGLDIANFNSPKQSVIAGATEVILAAEKRLSARDVPCILLNVSAAFHSRHMAPAQSVFEQFLKGFTFKDPQVPVIANVTARPYAPGQVAHLLGRQISSPVQWVDSIRYLMAQGDFTAYEMGADPNRPAGTVLSNLVDEIRRTEKPLIVDTTPPPAPCSSAAHINAAERLGSPVFRARYGVKYAYVAGSMGHGISSPQLVVRMAQAGMLAYLGTSGLSLADIETAIQRTQTQQLADQPYGINLFNTPDQPDRARATVNLCLKYNVRHLEVAAFTQITLALVLFRVKGLICNRSGVLQCTHRILAKVSRLESAEAFMSPPPAYLLDALLNEGAISSDQAVLARQVPMSDDICVDAYCINAPLTLLTPVLQLRNAMSDRFSYQQVLCVGLAGGIGTPESAAAAFMAGADFILTGSINQCTVEAGTTDKVKDLLQDLDVHDTTLAPAGDLFMQGAQVQVLNKGSLFAQRANWLYLLYSLYPSLQDIPETDRQKLERTVFKRSLDDVWNDVLLQLTTQGRLQEIQKAQTNPKLRMAYVLRWYFDYATEQTLNEGNDDVYNVQVHTSSALGAFNHWVKGTALQPWRQRHVDEIAQSLMLATEQHLRDGYERLLGTEK